MTKAGRIVLSVGVVLLAAAAIAQYAFSARRDLEVALAMKRLPASLHGEHVEVDAWTDYVVRAYFEIAPSDFEKLLAARQYEDRRVEFMGRAITPSAPSFPEVDQLVPKYCYAWHAADGTSCSLWADAEKKRVVLFYAAD